MFGCRPQKGRIERRVLLRERGAWDDRRQNTNKQPETISPGRSLSPPNRIQLVPIAGDSASPARSFAATLRASIRAPSTSIHTSILVGPHRAPAPAAFRASTGLSECPLSPDVRHSHCPYFCRKDWHSRAKRALLWRERWPSDWPRSATSLTGPRMVRR